MTTLRTWPSIPYPDWADTSRGLHLWCQIIGKYRLSHEAWVNHSWHATLYVTPRGLTTGPVPDANHSVSLTLDLLEHALLAEASDGRRERAALRAMSVADFYDVVARSVDAVGGTFDINGAPNELPVAVPFREDNELRPYDAAAIERFHTALIEIERVFAKFRTGFLGKVSPVHLFWGSFDLAVTRFSGRKAPLHPGGVPHLPDAVTREAYSHEVSSAGFWPGEGAGEPTFYSYAYPIPKKFNDQPISPALARWDEKLGEFLLPYAAVRASDDPERTLLEFLQSTYQAAAETARWDRGALECPIGSPGVPRPV